MSAPWDFEYAPTQSHVLLDAASRAVVVATEHALDESAMAAALTDVEDVRAVLDRAPLHWFLVSSAQPLAIDAVEQKLRAAGVPVRYVASARHPSMRVGRALALAGADPARASDWRTRERPIAADGDHPHRWFANDEGVGVDRGLCGFGFGTRLAVVDDDAGRTQHLGLDAIVPVMRSMPDCSTLSCHGAALIAWAVGGEKPAFAGVAPGASPRLYCIPKPGREVLALPLAIARAVLDGADVIACATYVEGTTSPMLDDALEVAVRLGRGGRGAPVVVAAGREICSPDRLTPSSLSIDLGDLAADPRAWCIGPSGREGGWFLFQDRRGRIRPFGNRGPSLRFLAPGDDTADPFAPAQLRHSESSGATAFAAGVALLALASAPELGVGELSSLLALTARRSDPGDDVERAGSSRTSEFLPRTSDRDGHNAKHGYGRLDAKTACCAAVDPAALLLAAIGESAAAQRWIRSRAQRVERGALFSPALGRSLVRALLGSDGLRQAGAVLARHLRLVAGHARRARAHAPGSLLRLTTLLLRDLERTVHDEPLQKELATLIERARTAASDEALAVIAGELWTAEPDGHPGFVAMR